MLGSGGTGRMGEQAKRVWGPEKGLEELRGDWRNGGWEGG